MAKRKGSQNGVNKSAAIRQILTTNPKTPVKDVVATLAQEGITVSNNLVYFLKSKMKQKKRRARHEQAVAATEKAGIVNPVQLILEVRKVAHKAGGIRHLKELVDLLAER